MSYALLAILIVIVAFLWWRWTSVERGARQRDERLLTVLYPIAHRLAKKEHVEPAEVAALARAPYSGPAGGFSRCSDKHGVVKPADLVDWYLDLMEKKGLGPTAGANNP
jgi:hypothetical protein